MRLPLFVLALSLAGAASRLIPALSLRPPPQSEPAGWKLPAGWDEMPPFAFERWVVAHLPQGRGPLPDRSTLEELAPALDRQDESSVRAAVLLGRSGGTEARGVLLARLEKRVLGPERASDAGDVIAAAALARGRAPGDIARRLARLGSGTMAHPDLEVRVECAAGALDLGRDEGIEFLLQVLRIDTPSGEADRRDFQPPPTTTWARARAARALARRAGIRATYNADGPLGEREREAAALERALERRAPPARRP